MASTDSHVSFVVIAHNEAPTIARTLESILAQEADSTPEIVVVDDASSDGTAAIVADFQRHVDGVTLISLDRNRGRGFARSTGIRAAAGRYIATVDGDIVLPPGWLASCLEALQDADAVCGTAIPDGDVAYLYTQFKLVPKRVSHRTEITGNNAVYRREVFDQVSFDPSLRDGEDVALNHALKQRGLRMHTVPDLSVRHEESKTPRAALAWLFQSGRGASRQFKRYRQPRLPDAVFAGWTVIVLYGISGIRKGRRHAIAAPGLYLAAAASAHVSGRFEWEPRRSADFAGAVVTDMALLCAYFSGRLVGLLKAQ